MGCTWKGLNDDDVIRGQTFERRESSFARDAERGADGVFPVEHSSSYSVELLFPFFPFFDFFPFNVFEEHQILIFVF